MTLNIQVFLGALPVFLNPPKSPFPKGGLVVYSIPWVDAAGMNRE